MNEGVSSRRGSRSYISIAYATGLSVVLAVHGIFSAPSLQALVVAAFCLLLFVSTLRLVRSLRASSRMDEPSPPKRSWQSMFTLSEISSAPVSTLTAMVGAYFASAVTVAVVALFVGLETDAGHAATQLTAALITIPLYQASHAHLDP